MGEEKKITITGVDSILIGYEFATGTVVAPGAFKVDPDNPDKDFAQNRKLIQVVVHDQHGVLLKLDNSGLSADVAIEIIRTPWACAWSENRSSSSVSKTSRGPA